MDHLESYLNNMLGAIANATTAVPLDAADISRMAKSLNTLTLTNTTLVRDMESLCADLENSSSHTANSQLDYRLSKT